MNHFRPHFRVLFYLVTKSLSEVDEPFDLMMRKFAGTSVRTFLTDREPVVQYGF